MGRRVFPCCTKLKTLLYMPNISQDNYAQSFAILSYSPTQLYVHAVQNSELRMSLCRLATKLPQVFQSK